MTDREDLYQQAIEMYADYRSLAVDDLARPTMETICAVVDLALDARPDRQPWEVLRWIADKSTTAVIERTLLMSLADRLETQHQAAQDAAAAEVAREKLIEQAAHLLHDAQEPPLTPIPWEQTTEARRRDLTAHARALVDAGWRPAPTTDGGEA